MRVINVRLLLIVISVFCVITAGLVVVHRLQAPSIRAALLRQAEQAESEGRLPQVVRHLQRYLEFAPEDLDARARLALTLAHPDLLAKPADRERARFVMEQVLVRDPERHAIRLALVNLALDSHHVDLAGEHLPILHKALPNDGKLAGAIGRWHELRGHDREALESYRQAVQQSPEHIGTHLRLVHLLRRLDRGRRGEHAQEARTVLKGALAQAPNDKGVLIAAATLAQDHGDLLAARSFLDRLHKQQPNEAQTYQALAHLEVRAEQRHLAMFWLEQGLARVRPEQRFDLYWTLANLQLDAGGVDEAQSTMRRIRECNPPRGTMDYLSARRLIAQEQWSEAARLLEQVRSAFRSTPALLLHVDLQLGRCYEGLLEPARHKIAYARAVELDPFCLAARHGYATALTTLGEVDAAQAEYRLIEQMQNEPQRRRDTEKH